MKELLHTTPKEETMEIKTREEMLNSTIGMCCCHESYKSRKMVDPNCFRCEYYDFILADMSAWERQQSAPLLKRIEELEEGIKRLMPYVSEINMRYETDYERCIKNLEKLIGYKK